VKYPTLLGAGVKPWPWQDKDRQERFWNLIRKTLALVSFNQLLLGGAFAWFTFHAVVENSRLRPLIGAPSYSWSSEDFPSHWTMLWQVIACMVIEDTLFYWGHRTLHHPALYPLIHKVHHQYMDATIGISAEYAHPVEFVVANLIPFSLAPTLLGMSRASVFMALEEAVENATTARPRVLSLPLQAAI
jgi:sterol desaturase/sphingolipid hydroxylase (fatty acid hydroxylase superfamily)